MRALQCSFSSLSGISWHNTSFQCTFLKGRSRERSDFASFLEWEQRGFFFFFFFFSSPFSNIFITSIMQHFYVSMSAYTTIFILKWLQVYMLALCKHSRDNGCCQHTVHCRYHPIHPRCCIHLQMYIYLCAHAFCFAIGGPGALL